VITFESKGDFKRTHDSLKKLSTVQFTAHLRNVAEAGVRALQAGTPKSSGLAASSWGYEITRTARTSSVIWTNSDVESGFPVAIMLQYGYATGTGGYVAGIDYINPAIKPLFDELADDIWKVVTSA